MSNRTYTEQIEQLESQVYDLEADAARWRHVRDIIAAVFYVRLERVDEVIDRLIEEAKPREKERGTR